MRAPVTLLLVLCLFLLCAALAVMAFPSHEGRTKRSPHHSKIRVKVVHRGPLGLRKHKYRYKGYGIGGVLGHAVGGYGHGGYGHGGYGLGGYGHGGYGLGAYAGSSSFASSFSSPFGSFASAGARAGR